MRPQTAHQSSTETSPELNRDLTSSPPLPVPRRSPTGRCVWSFEVFTLLYAIFAVVVDYRKIQGSLLAFLSIATVWASDLISA